jgi:NADPH:quinone reductase-like Zn-dependent oxidoreductase
VLQLAEVEQPSLLDDEQVLIRVHHASVNPGDYRLRMGMLLARPIYGLTKPKRQILGMDVAGTVEAVGKNVQRLKVGDRVFGSCFGSNAEYVCAPQSSISLMPKNATFAGAAAIPTAAQTALQALRDVAQIKAGQKVLIYGASGGIGHFAVQLASYYGTEVTAVCSTANLPWVKELGADHVMDYTKGDFTANGKRYDIILDAVGKRTFFSCLGSLTESGVYVTEDTLNPSYHPLQLLLSGLMGRKKGKAHLCRPNDADLDLLRGLVEEGRLRPMIERCYPLDQIVAAHRHVEGGHTKGKIVIAI